MEDKKETNKENKILIGIVAVVIVVILGYVGITNLIKENERIKQYNEDIDYCYTTIKDKSNWEGFKIVVDNHKEESDFEQKAYENLYRAIEERIENIKNGNDDEKLITMLGNAKTDSLTDNAEKKLEEGYLKAKSYSNLNKVNKNIEEQKYKEAYDLLSTVITSNKDKNQDIVELATNKQNEIKEKAFEQVIIQAQEKMNSQDYSSVKTILEKYKDLGNQTILDMYNNATNEVNRIEAEKKAQKEAEERARIEQEKKDFEIYCYFNMIAWKDKSLNDEQAFSRCASKFGITKEQAKESYNRVEPTSYSYQDKYPDIYNKYASQYYN